VVHGGTGSGAEGDIFDGSGEVLGNVLPLRADVVVGGGDADVLA